MNFSNPDILIENYSFSERKKNWLIKKAEKFIKKSFLKKHLLLIGYGGTISSWYSPTNETIAPLPPSPAKRSIDFMNYFYTSNIITDHIPLLDKDSRDITDDDICLLLDILILCPNEKILITVWTYLAPKITEVIFLLKSVLENKKIVITGSILPAGFVASDAEANIWSAILLLNYIWKEKIEEPFVALAFHGNTYSNQWELHTLDLHPEGMQNMIIQYPLSNIPISDI
jgi:L-asparaginase/Glu-tRNA(Gln) amidotransferase subunit D